MSQEIVRSQSDWRFKKIELTARLNVLRPKLINAEAELADKLASLNAFEFRLRALTNPLIKRLEALQQEIAKFRQQLRDRDAGLRFSEDDYDEEFTGQFNEFNVRSGEEAGSSEDFRYRDQFHSKRDRANLNQAEEANLKQLYRQLARRFHPDLGKSPEEREERTQIMMRINAAYQAGDLDALLEIQDMPDPTSEFATDSDHVDVGKLQRELERCQKRLAEIAEQMERLNRHKSARLLKRYERAKEAGRDLLAEMVVDIRNELGRRTAERDHLKDQLENFDLHGIAMEDERVAEAIFTMGLELGLDDDDTSPDTGWHTFDDDD